MRKIYQLLVLVAIGGSAALSSCTRATYTFQPNTPTYRGDAAEGTKRRMTVVAPAEPSASVQTVAPPLPIAVALRPKQGSGLLKKLGKPPRLATVLAAQRLVTSKVATQVVKTLAPRRSTAEHAKAQSKAQNMLFKLGGVLMAIGLVVFLATVAANPSLETGVILVLVALASFVAGTSLLIAALLRKD